MRNTTTKQRRSGPISHTAFTCTVICLSAIAIAGCGGGGGGGGGGAPGGPAGVGGFGVAGNADFWIEVDSVKVPDDLCPEVTFLITDDEGKVITVDELTDGRFILASLERQSVGSPYSLTSYTTRIEDPDGVADSGDEATQADYDPARLDGLTQNPDGTMTYKFDTALPPDYDQTATHQLGGQFRRVADEDGQTYVGNLVIRYRPDGQPVTETREFVDTESCNKCHSRLSFHGDVRREVQLCIMCHTTQTVDANTGNSLFFPEMIHKIHRGENLPSVEEGEPYQVVGYRDSVHDYSTVKFPQDIRNCAVCHESAPQGDIHKTAPTLEGCASCHDRAWFGGIDATPAGYENHVGGEQPNNQLCALCHSPEGSGVSEVDVAHLIPALSPAAPGLALEVTDVHFAAADGALDGIVSITFTAEDKVGDPVTDLADLNMVATTLAYPVSDYEHYIRETVQSPYGGPTGEVVNNGDGTYRYTFAATLPADSGETFAVAMEGRREFEFRGEAHTQGTATNGQVFFTIDGSSPQSRRQIIDNAKCNACHEDVRMHGSLRTGTEYCVMCHNPNTTDIARRPAENLPPVSVNFKEMIHRIHTGEELESDYTVFGYGGSEHDFTHVRFPADRRECTVCHVDGTYNVPLPAETISTVVTQDDGLTLVSEVLPTRAACTSCHDDEVANNHALINTQVPNGVETCAICHSDADEFSIPNVHWIEP